LELLDSKIKRYIRSIEEKKYKGVIYKTHDYPPAECLDNAKFVYIYSDPYVVVPSVVRRSKRDGLSWFKKHAKNLRAKGATKSSIYKEDVLGLESHFDAWVNFIKGETLYVRLGKLWSHKNELSDFLGFNVVLPEMKERSTSLNNISVEEKKDIEKTYKSLHEKVMSKEFEIRI
jgi:hypothetical protein